VIGARHDSSECDSLSARSEHGSTTCTLFGEQIKLVRGEFGGKFKSVNLSFIIECRPKCFDCLELIEPYASFFELF
jgi:hypothetical protein